MTNNLKKRRFNTYEDLGMLIQGLLTGVMFIFLILSLIYNELFILVEFIICILMFVLGYNNYKIYKRFGMSALYITFGIVVAVFFVSDLLHG